MIRTAKGSTTEWETNSSVAELLTLGEIVLILTKFMTFTSYQLCKTHNCENGNAFTYLQKPLFSMK